MQYGRRKWQVYPIADNGLMKDEDCGRYRASMTNALPSAEVVCSMVLL